MAMGDIVDIIGMATLYVKCTKKTRCVKIILLHAVMRFKANYFELQIITPHKAPLNKNVVSF